MLRVLVAMLCVLSSASLARDIEPTEFKPKVLVEDKSQNPLGAVVYVPPEGQDACSRQEGACFVVTLTSKDELTLNGLSDTPERIAAYLSTKARDYTVIIRLPTSVVSCDALAVQAKLYASGVSAVLLSPVLGEGQKPGWVLMPPMNCHDS